MSPNLHQARLMLDKALPQEDRMLRGRLSHVPAIRQFIEAGRAVITIVSKASGNRYTFRFSRPDEADTQLHNQAFGTRPIWVSLLSGQDNEADYSFMGTIFPARSTTELRPSSRSKVGTTAPSWIAMMWFLDCLYGDEVDQERLLRQAEVWHEGRCGRCGRKLTVPESIAIGFGPDCAGTLTAAPELAIPLENVKEYLCR